MSMIQLDDQGNPYIFFKGKSENTSIVVKRRMADDRYKILTIRDMPKGSTLKSLRDHTVYKDEGFLCLTMEISGDALQCFSDAYSILKHYKKL